MQTPALFTFPSADELEHIHRAARQRAIELRAQAIDAFWATLASALHQGASHALRSLGLRSRVTRHQSTLHI